jgi:cupin fold WbuC family metalloprotein
MKINLDELLIATSESPRKRYTWSPKDPSYMGCRYMVNAMMPGTYIPPHRHNFDGGNELWYVLRGVIIPVLFSEDGKIIDTYNLSSDEKFPLIELPEKIFHTLLVLKKPSIILEISKGPYDPKTFKEIASWAPSEDSREAGAYLKELEKRVARKL